MYTNKKIWRNLLCFLCALAILSTVVLPASAYTASSWAAESIADMDKQGMIPDLLKDADLRQKVTRKEMCYIAVAAYEKLMGKIPDTAARPFTDTSDQVIANAQSVKLVNGMTPTTFEPDAYLTREQLFQLIFNFLGTIGWKATADTTSDLVQFPDASGVSAWAMEATKNAVGLGIVIGSDGKLLPKENTSIQEAMLMYYRTYTYASEWKAIQEGNTAPLEAKYPNISSWALKEIQAMDTMGMIPTDLRGQSMTRAITRKEMCKTAVLAYEHIIGAKLAPSIETPFTDVDDPAVTVAYQLGIVGGMGDGTFAPNANITREQFFKMTVNFMNAVGYPYDDDPSADLSRFADQDACSAYAKGSTRLLVGLGIIKGSDGRLNCKSTISCQEALVVFYRSYDYLLNEWDFMTDPDDNNNNNNNNNNNGNTGNGDSTTDPMKPDPNEVATQKGVDLANLARKYVGYPYVWGGKDPSTGFDCSGFVYYVYQQFGYNLYRTANDQWLNGTQVSKANLAIGDIVYFSERQSLDYISHVGIYIGNGQIVHAANSRSGVIISSLSEGYYTRTYVGARRIITG